MCGICAAVGQKNQIENVLLGLEQLDYRGYDSAGVAYLKGASLQCCKCVGSVKNLEKKLQTDFAADLDNSALAHAVIGHTRWATHGQVCQNNAHPHISQGGVFGMVHNGIVENYAALAEKFEINNLKSETDTEIFVNLVEKMALAADTQGTLTTQNAQKEQLLQDSQKEHTQDLQKAQNSENMQEVQDTQKAHDARDAQNMKNVRNVQNAQEEEDAQEEIPQPLKYLMQAAKFVQGSYAVAMLCAQKQFENTIFVAKKGSPLMVAAENGVGMAASDIGVFAGHFSQCYVLDDEEFAVISAKNVQIFDKNGKKIQKNAVFLENFDDFDFSAKKSEEKFFMQKEINEQPMVLRKTYFKYFLEGVLSQQQLQRLKKFRSFCLVACGTAYHACLMGAHFLQQICKKPAQAAVASEFRYSQPILRKSCLYIFVSQSGETADTIACAKMVKDAGFCTMCVTNVPYCSLNSLADFVLPTFAGREVAVASTKAYAAQVFTLLIFATLLAQGSSQEKTENSAPNNKFLLQQNSLAAENEVLTKNDVCKEYNISIENDSSTKDENFAKNCISTKNEVSAKNEFLTKNDVCKENEIFTKNNSHKKQGQVQELKNFALTFQNTALPENLVQKVVGFKKIFFIGRGADYVTALEGALKLKEIAYIGCIGIAAGELKHGTLALVDENTLVVAICTQSALKEKMENNIREVQSRDGKVLVASQFSLSVNADFWIKLLPFSEKFMPIVSIVPLQQLALEFCVSLGNNPDKPRNLAKSVTVE